LITYLFHEASAQSLSGYCFDAADSSALPSATLQIIENGRWAIADTQGYFIFPSLKEGDYTLNVRMVGYKSRDIKVVVSAEKSTSSVVILLSPLSTELDGITVTARESTLGSISQLDGYAIKHTQPVSLADVLQLVPGQLAENPELGNAAQFTLRQAPAGAAAQRMNALGTALMMDGAPISNNANLQTNTNILNAAPGSLPPFSSVAGRGPDLRNVPADLIESVEVIRGVPSARYGDLTAGAVMVNTRIGAYRPRLLARVNPTVRQLSAGAGKKIGESDAINAELDLTTSLTDPRNDLEQFTRTNLQLGWRNQVGELQLNHRLTLFTTLDERREAPDDDPSQRSNFHRDRGIRLNSRGRWSGEEGFLDEFLYVFSLSYQRQESFFQELVTRDIFPVTDALADTTRPGEFGRSAYLNQTTVDGRPLNAYLRLETGHQVNDWLGSHRFLIGMEWRHDSNSGQGRQFDPRTPPRQNYSMGDRPRTYAEIPALNQIGLYLSDRWNLSLGERDLVLDLGLRTDLMPVAAQPELSELQPACRWLVIPAPRLNALLPITGNWQARAGFGIMAKMPTLSYLYPNPVFFDLVNFNYFAPDPAERLVVLSTRRIIPDTSPLQAYRSRKWEVGMVYSPPQGAWDFTFTVFQEQVNDGYQVLRQVLPIPNPKFEAVAFPTGQSPVLAEEPVAIDTFMAAYDLPQNNLAIRNQGFDFNLQTPQVEAIKTSFNLTGALLHTRSWQTAPFVDANRAVFSNQFSGRVPVYPAGQGLESMRFNTSLRLIHHIPALGFIVSGLVQTIWMEQNRLNDYSETAEAYIGRDGELTPLNHESISDDMRQELDRTINPASLEWQKRPPAWLFNMRLTKEWDTGRGFAFYVNNFMNSRPLFTSNVSGFRVERAQPEFFFGAELYYRL
jgi:outer membrane receptor protein involved in Fe transport